MTPGGKRRTSMMRAWLSVPCSHTERDATGCSNLAGIAAPRPAPANRCAQKPGGQPLTSRLGWRTPRRSDSGARKYAVKYATIDAISTYLCVEATEGFKGSCGHMLQRYSLAINAHWGDCGPREFPAAHEGGEEGGEREDGRGEWLVK